VLLAGVALVGGPGCGLWITDDELCGPQVDRVRWYRDADGDGFGDPEAAGGCVPRQGLVSNNADCDDADPQLTNVDDMGAVPGRTLWFRDRDRDGVGWVGEGALGCTPPAGFEAPISGDCDDDNPDYSIICPWADVAVGEGWSCGSRTDGTASCWGATGETTELDRLPAAGVAAVGGGYWVGCAQEGTDAVACSRANWRLELPGMVGWDSGFTATCAWDATGGLACYGFPGWAEWVDEDAPEEPVAAVSVGEDTACALLADGGLHCWGDALSFDPTPPEGDGFVAVQAGRVHACAARAGGGVDCWGEDPAGEGFAGVPQDVVFTALYGSSDQTCGRDAAGALWCWGTGAGRVETPAPVAVADASSDHACAVSEHGALWCWGDDSEGQLQVPTVEQRRIAAGGQTSCALDSAGRPLCWGDTPVLRHVHEVLAVGHDRAASLTAAEELQLWGRFDSTLSPELAERSWTALRIYSSSTGADEALCAVDGAGRLACWTDELNAAAYADLPAGEGFVDVAPGSLHGCALDGAGAVHCWTLPELSERVAGAPTDAGYVQLAAARDQTCAVHGSGRLACWGEGAEEAPLLDDAVAVSVHDQASCALRADGSLACWGEPGAAVVEEAPSAADFLSVTVAHDTGCGVTAAGGLRCWGAERGLDLDAAEAVADVQAVSVGYSALCLADGAGAVHCWATDVDRPLDAGPGVEVPGEAEALAVGGLEVCALRRGRAHCFGLGDSGQDVLGDGDLVEIAAGLGHVCGRSSDGSLACWGDDRAGQSRPPAGSYWALSAGGDHGCALDRGGSVHCWGALASPGLTGASAVASGRDHACVLVAGALACWGNDDQGQATPPTGADFVALALGDDHGCALDGAGRARCWGSDAHGQVSDAPPYPLVELAAGADHSCGVRLDGFATCWGRDQAGQSTPPQPTLPR
jgi:alpha-tubulin suppressor-like RCC1 family protein